MSLFDKISVDLTAAMKAKDKVRLESLRGLKKALLEAKTAKSATAELDDQEVLKIIGKLAKQGKDSAVIYREQSRPDLEEVELAQVAVFEEYLPQKMSDAELTSAIQDIIVSTGAAGMKDMGKVMGIASKQLTGQADGKDIADKVKALLA